MRSRKEDGRRAGLGLGEDGGALRPDRVEHGRQVLSPLLPGRKAPVQHATRGAASPSVEEDEPTERSQALVERGFRSHIPLQVEMAEAVVEDEIERAVTKDLIGDLGIADGHVARLWRVHLVDSVADAAAAQNIPPRGRRRGPGPAVGAPPACGLRARSG
jgi:hypothetical protein